MSQLKNSHGDIARRWLLSIIAVVMLLSVVLLAAASLPQTNAVPTRPQAKPVKETFAAYWTRFKAAL